MKLYSIGIKSDVSGDSRFEEAERGTAESSSCWSFKAGDEEDEEDEDPASPGSCIQPEGDEHTSKMQGERAGTHIVHVHRIVSRIIQLTTRARIGGIIRRLVLAGPSRRRARRR